MGIISCVALPLELVVLLPLGLYALLIWFRPVLPTTNSSGSRPVALEAQAAVNVCACKRFLVCAPPVASTLFVPPLSASACITNLSVKSGVLLVPSQITQPVGIADTAPDHKRIQPAGINPPLCPFLSVAVANVTAPVKILVPAKVLAPVKALAAPVVT